MTMQDPTKAGAFDLTTLSAAILLMPTVYGRIGQLGLFNNTRNLNTTTALFEEKNGTLSLIPSKPYGAPGTPNKPRARRARSFVVPHIPMQDEILPEAYQNVREFGTESNLTPLQRAVNDSLQDMRNKIDITKEHLRMGALKGEIRDADGSVLYDLFTEFGITKKTIDFELDVDETDVLLKCLELKRHIEDNVLGEVFTRVHAVVSQEFYDALVTHPRVEHAYANYQAAQERLGGDLRSGFTFGDVTFEEYRAHAPNPGGTTTRFIAAGDGHAFPVGTASSFYNLNAPAPYNETVNTVAQAYYAKMEPRKFGKGYDVEAQANYLPLCARPALLVELKAS